MSSKDAARQKQWDVNEHGERLETIEHFVLITRDSHALIGVFDSSRDARKFVDADSAYNGGNVVVQTALIEKWVGAKRVSVEWKNLERRTWLRRTSIPKKDVQ